MHTPEASSDLQVMNCVPSKKREHFLFVFVIFLNSSRLGWHLIVVDYYSSELQVKLAAIDDDGELDRPALAALAALARRHGLSALVLYVGCAAPLVRCDL